MVKKAITVKNLIKRYKKADFNAVDDISFEVKEGEFFAFLGPNGAGKTTTISVLNTTLAKTSGEAKISGFDIDKESKRVRKNIGVIFQNPSLDKNLTAEENIRFHAALYGLHPYRPRFSMMPNTYQNKVKKLAVILGIKDEIHNPIKSFSGGMKRKLEIIRSLMHNPRVLFLDEPTSGLDPASRKSLWKYLNEVRRLEKTTIFLTTHYLEEAEEADRVAIINKGKIVSLGIPADIKKDLVQNYITAKSKNEKSFEKELKKLKLKYDKNGDFKIYLNGKSAQKIIQSIKSSLFDLDIHKPTLEEAYLEIVMEKDEIK